MSARPLRRLAVAGAAGAAVLLALPTAAGAHVEAEGQTVEGVTTVEFSFHHGCDGAATTALRVQLPEGATDVEPQDPPGWTSEVSGGELTWTGGSIADGEDGNFVASMVLVDAEGTTVFLPTVQVCGTAESAWIDKSDDPEAENAAPRITAGAASATAGHDEGEDGEDAEHGSFPSGTTPEKTTNEAGAATTTTAKATGETITASPATESSSSSSAPLIIGVVAAVVVIGGLLAYFVTRKGSSPGSSGPADPS